jgi:hypothetical protein
MYFVNEYGKIIKTKHHQHCKCQHCCPSSSFTFTNIILVIILAILFYYIWKIIITMKEKNSVTLPSPPATAPIASKNNLL